MQHIYIWLHLISQPTFLHYRTSQLWPFQNLGQLTTHEGSTAWWDMVSQVVLPHSLSHIIWCRITGLIMYHKAQPKLLWTHTNFIMVPTESLSYSYNPYTKKATGYWIHMCVILYHLLQWFPTFLYSWFLSQNHQTHATLPTSAISVLLMFMLIYNVLLPRLPSIFEDSQPPPDQPFVTPSEVVTHRLWTPDLKWKLYNMRFRRQMHKLI